MLSDASQAEERISELSKRSSTKEKFSFMAKVIQGESTANTIFSTQKQFLQRWLNSESQDFEAIQKNISSIVDNG